MGWLRPVIPVAVRSKEALKDAGQTLGIDRLVSAYQFFDRPPPMTDDRGLLHFAPIARPSGILEKPRTRKYVL
jgi:hypothetical protein